MKKKTIVILAGAVLGLISGAGIALRMGIREKAALKELSDKHCALMQLLNRWLAVKQEGKSIIGYFRQNGIKSVAIYGMGCVGERLFDEMKDSIIKKQ